MRLSTLMLLTGAVLGALTYYVILERFGMGEHERAFIGAVCIACVPITLGLMERLHKDATEVEVYVVDEHDHGRVRKVATVRVRGEWYGHTSDEQHIQLFRTLNRRYGVQQGMAYTAYAKGCVFSTERQREEALTSQAMEV